MHSEQSQHQPAWRKGAWLAVVQHSSVGSLVFQPFCLLSTPSSHRSCQVILTQVQLRLPVGEGWESLCFSFILLRAQTGVPGSWCGLTQLNLLCPLLRKCLRHCEL